MLKVEFVAEFLMAYESLCVRFLLFDVIGLELKKSKNRFAKVVLPLKLQPHKILHFFIFIFR